MKYMMVVKYDGSKFFGFQRQKDVRNVQGYLENKLSNFLDEEIVIKGAGRTDRGVHANYQVVHFETEKNISNIKRKLNKELEDIKIKKVKIVDKIFHARHSVVRKTYIYKVDLSNKRNPDYYAIVKNKLDIKKMKRASKLFVGTHNFKNFVSGQRDNYESTIFRIKIYKFNNVIYFKFIGIGFYRYMVRNLVGALLEVGKNKIKIDVISDMLSDPSVEKRLPTSTSSGLYLDKIKY